MAAIGSRLISVDAGPQSGPEGVLHAAVFAAVEADDRGDAAGGEGLGDHGEEPVEVGQLAVDEDARWKCAAAGWSLAGGTLPVKSRLADDLGELLGGGDGVELRARR